MEGFAHPLDVGVRRSIPANEHGACENTVLSAQLTTYCRKFNEPKGVVGLLYHLGLLVLVALKTCYGRRQFA